MVGSTTSVSRVEVNRPPTTTAANGRCTLDPMSLARSNGNRPRPVVRAVIKTGRRRSSEALTTDFSVDFLPQLIDVGYNYQPVEYGYAENRDKAYRSRYRQVQPGNPECKDPPNSGKRNVQKDEYHIAPAKYKEDQE